MKTGKIIAALVLGLAGSFNAGAYVLDGSSWPDSRTTFHIDISLKGVSTSPSGVTWNDAFREAAAKWNAQSNFVFTVDTTDPSHPCAGVGSYPQDGFRNGADFHARVCNQVDNSEDDFGSKTLAVTVSYVFTSKPEEKVETDIFFNEAESWDIYDGAARSLFDFKRVALHELGHVLGLGHEESNPAIMQPTVGDTYNLLADDIAGVQSLYGASVDPGDPPIRMAIEEPFDGDIKEGISNFRGWVVSMNPLVSLTLYRDGVLFDTLDHNGKRLDVGNRYPDYPGAANSGFSFTTNFGILSAGQHDYRLVARDDQGNTLEKTVTFYVQRFDDPWVGDENLVSLDNARVSISGSRDISIEGLSHNGKEYDVILHWKTSRQGFDIIRVTRTR
ncbi:matrixin family metalloprotease [Thiolapillus sp.]